MRLVGATNCFVRLPYVLDGLVKGLLGGVLAVGLAWGARQLVARMVLESAFFTPLQIAGGIAVGGALGCLASWLSVGRHLRRVWRDA